MFITTSIMQDGGMWLVEASYDLLTFEIYMREI